MMEATTEYLSLAEAFNVYVLQVPTYHLILELVLVAGIVTLFFSKSFGPRPKPAEKPTREEEDELIAEWQPEPLVPAETPSERAVDPAPVITGLAGAHMTVDGVDTINLATFNFHNLLEREEVQSAAERAVNKYGVGTCGPRGFYGTMDVHLDLENHVAKFLSTEEAIVYSYGFSTIASVIPAYSKRSDILFCDEGVNFAVQKGVEASRSKVRYFKHNDMDHLQRLLEEQQQQDIKNPAKAKVTRKFIVAEGLYVNYGDLAPLPRMVELRAQYRVPILLDESLSFGVLGETGRGATQHWGVPVDEVDIIMVSMENVLASVGGFCTGKAAIIGHQRLSSLGYCFSASLPPLHAVTAMEGIDIIGNSPSLHTQLIGNVQRFRQLMEGVPGVLLVGDETSPVLHLRLKHAVSPEQDRKTLDKMAATALDDGVSLCVAKYLEDEEKFLPPPSIRVCLSSALTEEDLVNAVRVIKSAAAQHAN